MELGQQLGALVSSRSVTVSKIIKVHEYNVIGSRRGGFQGFRVVEGGIKNQRKM